MAGNWRRDEEEEEERMRRRGRDDKTGEGVAAALVGGAMLAGGAYALYKGFEWLTSSDAKKQPEQQQQQQRQPPSFLESVLALKTSFDCLDMATQNAADLSDGDDNEEDLSIAVDATKDRAGGFLLLPRSKEIYFYSIDWSDIFSFPDEPDKFEMVNAFLALEIFDEYVSAYRKRYPGEGTLFLKTDNTFCTNLNPARTYPGERNADYRDLFMRIDTQLKSAPFKGKWRYVWDVRSDIHLTLADRLSKSNCTESRSIPHPANKPDPYPDYTEVNLSESDYAVVHTVARVVPSILKR